MDDLRIWKTSEDGRLQKTRYIRKWRTFQKIEDVSEDGWLHKTEDLRRWETTETVKK